MIGLETKPYREAHADLFQPHPVWSSQFEQAKPMLELLGKCDQACVHLHQGRILFIGGYHECAPGVAEVFLYPSVHIEKNKKTYLAEVKFWLAHLKTKYRRLQCWGENTDASYLWLTHLGFTCEGKLRYYTVEGDMLIWGMV